MADDRLETVPATHKMSRGLPNEQVWLNQLEVGPLPSYEVTVTPEDVDRWARLHDDDSSWYRGPSPWGGPVAPSYILYYPSQSMLGREIMVGGSSGGGGGFARYRAEFLGPIPIGRPIRVDGAITDKFVRRRFGYLDWQLEATCDGRVVQRHWKSWAFAVTPEEMEALPERPIEPRPELSEPIADLGKLQLVVGPERTRDFEGPGERNGHTEFRPGRTDGLFAQGEISFGLLYRLMCDRFLARFAIGGTLDVRFVRPVFTTETLTGRGEVLSEAGGRASCRVWVENSQGEAVTVGTATACLPLER